MINGISDLDIQERREGSIVVRTPELSPDNVRDCWNIRYGIAIL